MIYAIYVLGFLAASAAIFFGSTWTWRRFIRAMPSPPNWREAVTVIWVEGYRLPETLLPRFVFVRGEYFIANNGEKVAGNSDAQAVTIAVKDDFIRPSELPLAHELRHVARRRLGLDPDGDHITDDWKPGGIVARTNALVKARGW